ncbi:MAG TPA: TlpA disulfide reductase family protein [Candidatus Polarisedimenticolia bacterium]|nr:TlpA disulfide reductase family protein [Candidatus Polarisedimenticolia bacterium]
MKASRGDTRIERCKAFLDKYPDYPEADLVRGEFVKAAIDKANPDFVQLDAVLRPIVDRTSPSEYYPPESLLELYYLKDGFPTEMSEVVARKAREQLTRERQEIDLGDPKRRAQKLRKWGLRDASLSLSEARLLLAKKDYPGALRALQALEAANARVGYVGLPLIDARGRVAGSIPRGTMPSDRFNLTFAAALARSGRREEAIARLDRVRDFEGGNYPEIGRETEALRREIEFPPPPRDAVRAEPKPAADFRLKDLQGRPVALSDFRGRVVLVMFWATW